MLRTKTALFTALVLAALAAGRDGHAGTLTGPMNLTLETQGPHAPGGLTVSLYTSLAGSNLASDGRADLSQGGAFEWKINSGSSLTSASFVDPIPRSPTNQLLTFCIEINQNIGFGAGYTYNLISLKYAPQGTPELPVNSPANGNSPGGSGMGPAAALLIEELWAMRFQEIFNPTASDLNAGLTKDVQAGAFQLAIWKLEYDHASAQYSDPYGTPGSVNFGAGFLRVNDPHNLLATTAAGWIDSLANFKGTPADLVALTSPTAQDQLAEDPPLQTPEPASALVWLALVCAALATRLLSREAQPRAAVLGHPFNRSEKLERLD